MAALEEGPPEVRSAVEGLLFAAKSEAFQGMPPKSEHAVRYEKLVPGCLERLLTMREEEQSYSIERDRKERVHDHEWERREQEFAHTSYNRSLILGSAIAFALVVGAVVCGAMGEPGLGGGLVAASAMSLVPAILKSAGRRHSRRSNTGSENDGESGTP